MAGGVVGHNSEKGPSKDHACKVWSKLVQWFQRRRLKCKKLTTDGRTMDGRPVVAIAHVAIAGELINTMKYEMMWIVRKLH